LVHSTFHFSIEHEKYCRRLYFLPMIEVNLRSFTLSATALWITWCHYTPNTRLWSPSSRWKTRFCCQIDCWICSERDQDIKSMCFTFVTRKHSWVGHFKYFLLHFLFFSALLQYKVETKNRYTIAFCYVFNCSCSLLKHQFSLVLRLFIMVILYQLYSLYHGHCIMLQWNSFECSVVLLVDPKHQTEAYLRLSTSNANSNLFVFPCWKWHSNFLCH